MHRKCDVLLYGDVLLDFLLYIDDQPVFSGRSYVAKNFYVSPGGAAANTAVALSRLGVNSCLISAVGSDLIGRILIEDLDKESVSTKYVKVNSGKRSGIVVSIVTNGKEKILLSYRGACSENTVPISEVLNELKDVKLVYASGYTFYNIDRGSSIVELFKIAHDNEVKTFLELGGITSADSHILQRLKGSIDFATMNDQELISYMNTPDVNRALLEFFNLIEPVVILIKMGGKGSIVYDGNTVNMIPPCNTNAIDPTGCGDAFNAGVIYGLLKELDPATAAKIGNAMGAYKAMGYGARFLPRNVIELEEFTLKHCLFRF